MDKVREEFEAWFMKEKADKIQDDIQFLTKEIMYEAWKASRESLVIELPESVIKGMACVYYNHDIENTIENVGVNYK